MTRLQVKQATASANRPSNVPAKVRTGDPINRASSFAQTRSSPQQYLGRKENGGMNIWKKTAVHWVSRDDVTDPVGSHALTDPTHLRLRVEMRWRRKELHAGFDWLRLQVFAQPKPLAFSAWCCGSGFTPPEPHNGRGQTPQNSGAIQKERTTSQVNDTAVRQPEYDLKRRAWTR